MIGLCLSIVPQDWGRETRSSPATHLLRLADSPAAVSLDAVEGPNPATFAAASADFDCKWDPHATVFGAARPRPLGAVTYFHCSSKYQIPLPRPRRNRISTHTFERFTREFNDLFDAVAVAPRSGNAAFRCVTDCDAGPEGPWTEHWGAAFVSVDGHTHARGFKGHVSLMSQSKIVAYALALRTLGVDKVLQFVSAEPSGRTFGDMSSMKDHRAFNPYVSTGAELIWALLEGVTPGGYRSAVELNRELWEQLSRGAGGEVRLMGNDSDAPAREAIRALPSDPRDLMSKDPGINLATIYVAAARLLAHGGSALPGNWTPEGTYQGFVQANNLRLTPLMMATVASTLANAGVNPLTGEEVLPPRLVRYMLATMQMAGMYDQSGRWAFEVGMPSKSGVAGGLLVVAPGVGGFATVSEPLNQEGNSARGVAFFGGLVHRLPMLHGFSPSAGEDPNIALTPDESCVLKAHTRNVVPDHFTPL